LYLIVFTRKRLVPLVRKFSALTLLAVSVVLVVLAAAVAWLQLETAELRRQVDILTGQIAVSQRRLAEVSLETPVSGGSAPADILIDLRAPAEADIPPGPAAETPAQDNDGPYAVQISSHHSREEALRVVTGLAGSVPRPLLIQQAALANGSWYRVLLEPFSAREQAVKFADSLCARGVFSDYVLQRLPAGWRDNPNYSFEPPH